MQLIEVSSKPSDLTRLLIDRTPSVLPTGKVSHHVIDVLPFGILADVHGNLQKVKDAIAAHPEVSQWFCLGDIVDFPDRFRGNKETLDWWKTCNIPTCIGNHDRDFASRFRSDIEIVTWIKNLPRSLMLILPTSDHILCYHSLPDDLVTFVEPGFSERQFIDEYPYDENTLAVAVGHNHKQFKQVYYGVNAELWSVGSIGLKGEYTTVGVNGVQFHKIPGEDKFKVS